MSLLKAAWTRHETLLWAAALIAVAAVAAAHHGPDSVVLDDGSDKKGPVEFPHAAHIAVVSECATCHHTNEGLTAETDAEVQPCSACHLDPEDDATPSSRQMSMQKNPYHISCVGCHKDEGAGPTKCNDCHGT
ncbi:MAG TPA: cytochrome c3 family protein [Chondromyces sp.]|nr:cytochrome c3 family protein [Chondromyces sp.]